MDGQSWNSLLQKYSNFFMDTFRQQLLTRASHFEIELLYILEELSPEHIHAAMDMAINKCGITPQTIEDERLVEKFSEVLFLAVDQLAHRDQKLTSTLPTNSLITNSNVANAIQNLSLDVENLVPVVKKGEVVAETKITINFLDDENIRLSNNSITEYDKMVHDAICTLYAAGNKLITADMVYRAMNGFVETEKVSDRAIRQIEKSIWKMGSTRIYIDSTEQMRAAGIIDSKRARSVMSEHMINLRELTVIAGGSYKTAYRLLTVPIIYSYSVMEDQILNIPRELLNTKDVMRSSETIMMIRYHLLRRIETMKQSPADADYTISYESLYALVGSPEERQARAAIRSSTEKLLNNYTKMGYIAGFRRLKQGTVILGVTILLPSAGLPDAQSADEN